jgi:hypothetical protein
MGVQSTSNRVQWLRQCTSALSDALRAACLVPVSGTAARHNNTVVGKCVKLHISTLHTHLLHSQKIPSERKSRTALAAFCVNKGSQQPSMG